MTEQKVPLLIQNGFLVTNDRSVGDIRHGSILIEDGAITQIGEVVNPPENAEVIDGDGMIVIPGFVDTHHHLWQTALRGVCADRTLVEYFEAVRQNYLSRYRPTDAAIGTLAGALELIDSGTTSVLDHSHGIVSPDHSDAIAEAILRSGLRGVWAYGFCPVATEDGAVHFDTHYDRRADVERVRSQYFGSSTGIMQMGISATEQGLLPFELTEMEIRTAIDLDMKWTSHVHCGVGTAPVTRGFHKLVAADLITPLAVLSHLNEFSYNEFIALKDLGAHFASSPLPEIGMGIPKPVNYIEALAAGVDISLGTDTPTCMASDMFNSMRAALLMVRHQINSAASAGFQFVGEQKVTTRDVFEWATINGAKALGIDHLVGSLEVGKRADIVLIDSRATNLAPVLDPVADIVFNAHPGNVDTVLIDGVIRKRGGKLIGIDTAVMFSDLADSKVYLMNEVQDAFANDQDQLRGEIANWTEKLNAVVG